MHIHKLIHGLEGNFTPSDLHDAALQLNEGAIEKMKLIVEEWEKIRLAPKLMDDTDIKMFLAKVGDTVYVNSGSDKMYESEIIAVDPKNKSIVVLLVTPPNYIRKILLVKNWWIDPVVEGKCPNHTIKERQDIRELVKNKFGKK